MKKKLLIAMIPVLGMGALVGSGFSAWVFTNEDDANVDFGGTITVTTAASNIDIVAMESKAFTLELDQGTKSTDATDGITLSWNDGAPTMTFTLKTNDITPLTSGYSAQIKLGIDLVGSDADGYAAQTDIDNYLVLSTNAMKFNTTSFETLSLGSGNLGEVVSYTYETGSDEGSGLTTGTWTFTTTIFGDLTNVIDYADSKKPTDYNSWLEMKNALDTKQFNLNISIEAQIVK